MCECKWASMETAPKDGTEVLLYCKDDLQVGAWQEGWWWVLCEYTLQPTHWMPLPAAPPPEREP